MNLSFKILSVCFVFFSCLNAQAQEKKSVSATLLNAADSTAIAYAHIINHKLNVGTSSNVNGKFTIGIRTNDSLMISKIGFKTIHVDQANFTDTLYLSEKDYPLDQVTIFPYQTYEEFREAFANVKLPEDKPKLNRSIFLSVEELKFYDGSKGFGGGISWLLSRFNKRMKDKRNYIRLLQKDEYETFLASKFNPVMIERITRLDHNEAELFMDYCDFSNHYIEHSSEYDIITQIFDCYEEYNALPKTSN